MIRKLIFLRAHNICLFGLFYYFVTLSQNREESEGIIKETKSLCVVVYGPVQIAAAWW